jgi:hypothetical protein
LRRRRQIAERIGTGAQALDRGHHFLGLREKRHAELLGPFEVFIHPFEDVGIMREGAHAFIPRLLVHLLDGAAFFKVTRGEHDVRRVCRGRQYDADQRVGIERDGSDEGFDFGGCELLCLGGCGCSVSCKRVCEHEAKNNDEI